MPYEHDFVQYRPVINLTLTATDQEQTPFITLPMVFPNAHTLEFTVPAHVLLPGKHYEFRLGFAFSTYTYYTNQVVAKTFDSSSPFVSHVQMMSTSNSITVSWLEPEYAEHIIGYSLRVLYNQLGNGDATNYRQWNVSMLSVFDSRSLTLSQTSQTITCSSTVSSRCLSPFTTYVLEIAVIRETGHDMPSYYYVSTQKVPVVKKNTAAFNLHAAHILVSFLNGVEALPVGTRLVSTAYSPAYITSQNSDLLFGLNRSTIESVSSNVVKITFSEDEYSLILKQLLSLSFSPLTLHYGQSQTILMSVSCL